VAYWNIRLLRRNVRASYKGVTHEYLNILSSKNQLRMVWAQANDIPWSNRAQKSSVSL
jgi:hypothetical protein